MIITQTPVRISFLGGGTDYPEYFSRFGGATLGTTIDRYTYVTVSPLTRFFDHRIRISYSKTELCKSVDEIQHPAVRECLRFMNIEEGVEIAVVSDLPARTGLGSSSCFTVGLLHALYAFKGTMVSRERLARESVYVEREMIKERVGLQDQYTCACGGILHLEFRDSSRVHITPITISSERARALEERLMILYTGIQRNAHQVLEEQVEKTKSGAINSHLAELHGLVPQGVEVLSNGHDLAAVGELLHQGWLLKRRFSDAISNSFIDDAYERARRAGAVGGKLLGAGSGGFLLLYVEPYNQRDVERALPDLRRVDFHLENGGSRVIFYQRS
jgi:D-glycero-alpha-D-manno-heptose-7-phosphate kinase